MTTEDLRGLIEGGENLNVEFKSDGRAALSDDDLLELVVCLANRPGSELAWLLVNVEDYGRFTGARDAAYKITARGINITASANIAVLSDQHPRQIAARPALTHLN